MITIGLHRPLAGRGMCLSVGGLKWNNPTTGRLFKSGLEQTFDAMVADRCLVQR
jgi:hypothetical protein